MLVSELNIPKRLVHQNKNKNLFSVIFVNLNLFSVKTQKELFKKKKKNVAIQCR